MRLDFTTHTLDAPGEGWFQVHPRGGFAHRDGRALLSYNDPDRPGETAPDVHLRVVKALVREREDEDPNGLAGPLRQEAHAGDPLAWSTVRVSGRARFVGVRRRPGNTFVVALDLPTGNVAEAEQSGVALLRSLATGRVDEVLSKIQQATEREPRPDQLMPLLVGPSMELPTMPGERLLPYGLRALLVEDLDGASRYLKSADAARLPFGMDEAWSRALANLEAYARRTAFRGGGLPDGTPIVTHTAGSWAATCLLLPNLHGVLARAFPTTRARVVVPHRDALIAYPDTPAAQAAIERFVLPEEARHARKPLTNRPYLVDATGVFAAES